MYLRQMGRGHLTKDKKRKKKRERTKPGNVISPKFPLAGNVKCLPLVAGEDKVGEVEKLGDLRKVFQGAGEKEKKDLNNREKSTTESSRKIAAAAKGTKGGNEKTT